MFGDNWQFECKADYFPFNAQQSVDHYWKVTKYPLFQPNVLLQKLKLTFRLLFCSLHQRIHRMHTKHCLYINSDCGYISPSLSAVSLYNDVILGVQCVHALMFVFNVCRYRRRTGSKSCEFTCKLTEPSA